MISSCFAGQNDEPELTTVTIQILHEFLPLMSIINDENVKLKYMEIIINIRSLILEKNKCGVKTVTAYINYLREIFKYDSENSWMIPDGNSVNCKIYEDIIQLLKHPYHEVRLSAAKHVGILFKKTVDKNDSNINFQREMFKNLLYTFNEYKDLYEGQGEENVIKYTKYVTSAVTFLTLANIICLSKFWRKNSLFYLIYFSSNEKKINSSKWSQIR